MTLELNRTHLTDNRQWLSGLPENTIDTYISHWPTVSTDITTDITTDQTLEMVNTMLQGQTHYSADDTFIPGPDYAMPMLNAQKHGGFNLVFCTPNTVDFVMCSLRMAGYWIVSSIVWLYSSDFNDPDLPPIQQKKLIVVAQKPIKAKLTIKDNVAMFGTGELNLDAARLKANGQQPIRGYTGKSNMITGLRTETNDEARERITAKGRVPSNVILSHSLLCRFFGSKEVGYRGAYKISRTGNNGMSYGRSLGAYSSDPSYGENGKETVQNWECTDYCVVRGVGESSGILKNGSIKPHHKNKESANLALSGKNYERSGVNHKSETGTASRYYYNSHTTARELYLTDNQPFVIPIDVARYLAVLTSNPDGGGIVCDPFAGSNSILIGAKYADRDFIGLENYEVFYLEGVNRLNHVMSELNAGRLINTIDVSKKKLKPAIKQLEMF